MHKILALFLVLVFGSFFKIEAQNAPTFSENITDKVILGLPGITAAQLADIKSKILTSAQIESAIYVYNDHQLLLLKLNSGGNEYKQFYDLAKALSPYFDMEKMYLKPYFVYDEIMSKLKGLTYSSIK